VHGIVENMSNMVDPGTRRAASTVFGQVMRRRTADAMGVTDHGDLPHANRRFGMAA
jgi:Mrp family chromosome partitioning ATPase